MLHCIESPEHFTLSHGGVSLLLQRAAASVVRARLHITQCSIACVDLLYRLHLIIECSYSIMAQRGSTFVLSTGLLMSCGIILPIQLPMGIHRIQPL